MTDPRALLERHTPRLVYDSQEAYFADSAAVWTDSPTNILRRADGAVDRQAAEAVAGATSAATYRTARRCSRRRDRRHHPQLREERRSLHARPRYANRVYGHARRDSKGRLWLQYWLFYYYNDFKLVGKLISGGKHEGDWELVQSELGADERPVRAVYSPSTRSREQAVGKVVKQRTPAGLHRSRLARELLQRRLALDRHLVRPGRRQGPEDRADARDRRDGHPSGCTGPVIGVTRRPAWPLDSNSPTSPGRARRTGWTRSR